MKAVLLGKVVGSVARILSLQDRRRCSYTFGCFDRPYWAYGMKSFSSSVCQMYSLVLAYLYKYKFAGNKYYRKDHIRKYAIAGLNYTTLIQDKNGSFSEYFLHDNDVGATAFNLINMIKTSNILKVSGPHIRKAVYKSAMYLYEKNYKYEPSNHILASAYALFIAGEYLTIPWICTRADDLVRWCIQHKYDHTGYFDERGGGDPGYNTLSLKFLSQFDQVAKQNHHYIKFAIAKYTLSKLEGGHTKPGTRNNNHLFICGFVKSNNTPSAMILDGFKDDIYALQDDYYLCYSLVDWLESFLPGNDVYNGNYHEIGYKPANDIVPKVDGFIQILICLWAVFTPGLFLDRIRKYAIKKYSDSPTSNYYTSDKNG